MRNDLFGALQVSVVLDLKYPVLGLAGLPAEELSGQPDYLYPFSASIRRRGIDILDVVPIAYRPSSLLKDPCKVFHS